MDAGVARLIGVESQHQIEDDGGVLRRSAQFQVDGRQVFGVDGQSGRVHLRRRRRHVELRVETEATPGAVPHHHVPQLGVVPVAQPAVHGVGHGRQRLGHVILHQASHLVHHVTSRAALDQLMGVQTLERVVFLVELPAERRAEIFEKTNSSRDHHKSPRWDLLVLLGDVAHGDVRRVNQVTGVDQTLQTVHTSAQLTRVALRRMQINFF